MKKIISAFVVLMAVFCSSNAHALFSPAAISILAPVQFPDSDFKITGFRGSLLWGAHHTVYGLDLGVIGNMTHSNFGGIGVSGIFNMNHGISTILFLQAAGIANVNVDKASIYGVQTALGFNLNKAESILVGLQLSLANISAHTTVCGLQVGAFNSAREVYGLQIGVVNIADTLHGLQIGLVNYNKTGLFSVAPLLNVGF